MSWREYRLGDFLKRRKDPVKIQPTGQYTLVTIRMYHKGIVKRADVAGGSIKSPTMYRVSSGQFILSGIDARNGAFGIVPEELNGGVVTNDFWTHDIDTTIIDAAYFYWFTTTPQFYNACIKASEGTTNRQRLQADKFYQFKVPLPSLPEQRKWVKQFKTIEEKYQSLMLELSQQQTYLQRLRQTILQEAVQGKLTHRLPTDEPASLLLQRIKAEKAKLVKEGKLKKEKELPPVREDEVPFALPEGWVWCRLGEICTKIGSGSTPKGGKEVYVSLGVKFIRSQNVYNEGLVFDNVAFIDEAVHKKMEGTKVISSDLLLNITGGSIGRCALVRDDFDEANVNQHVTIIRTVSRLERQYIHQLIISPYFQDYIMATQTGGNREGLAKKNMELMLIPLPPLAEQKRIVIEVQQLNQKLDQLQIQVQQSRQHAQQLLQAVLKEAFTTKGKVYQMNETISLVAEN